MSQGSIPYEATAYLSFVGACMVFLVVFYLYLTKKLCFTTVGNFPCFDEPLKLDKDRIIRDLGATFGSEDEDDEDDTSTDSENEVLQRLTRSNSSYNTFNKRQTDVKSKQPQRQDLDTEVDNYEEASKYGLHESSSYDRLLARSESSTSTKSNQRQSSSSSLIKKNAKRSSRKDEQRQATDDNQSDAQSQNQNIRHSENQPQSESKEELHRSSSAHQSIDFISLAEKGRVGKTGFSGGSGSSENGSADTEEEALIPVLHEKAKQKAEEARQKRSSALEKASVKGQSGTKKRPGSTSSTKSGKERTGTVSYHHNSGYDEDDEDENSGRRSVTSGGLPESGLDTQLVKCGSLEVSYAFDAPTKRLNLNVFQAQGLPSKDRGGANQVHVRLVLLPHKRQKFKTKSKPSGKGNPVFNESFTFTRVSPDDILGYGVRFRLYGSEKLRREHLIGEAIVFFSSNKPLEQETRAWLTLEPRSNIARSDSRSDVSSLARSDSTGSTQSMQNASLPELLMGLSYNGTTGRLQVTVIKGSQFRNATMTRAPDTYCKLTMVSSTGQEIARSKTSIRRGQPNPLFKETFVFQVALFQLPDVTLMISVYNKRSMKRKEMIGWFSLGLNSSGEEEMAHWNDMRDSKGEQVCRWHVLLDS